MLAYKLEVEEEWAPTDRNYGENNKHLITVTTKNIAEYIIQISLNTAF